MLNEESQEATAGTRVEIRITFLTPDERAEGLPSDTANLPYDGRIRGTLLGSASRGEVVHISTRSGREIAGVLETIEPADTHSFGRPVPALTAAVEAIHQSKTGSNGSGVR